MKFLILIATIFSLQIKAEVMSDNLTYLSEAIYFEARGESTAGQLAVAHVIMNRILSPRFPNTVKGVVHSWRWSGGKKVCAFSYYCDGKPETYDDYDAYLAAVRVASFVLSGKTIDLTDGADHYFNPHILNGNPVWSNGMTFMTTIDNHVFYKAKP